MSKSLKCARARLVTGVCFRNIVGALCLRTLLVCARAISDRAVIRAKVFPTNIFLCYNIRSFRRIRMCTCMSRAIYINSISAKRVTCTCSGPDLERNAETLRSFITISRKMETIKLEDFRVRT